MCKTPLFHKVLSRIIRVVQSAIINVYMLIIAYSTHISKQNTKTKKLSSVLTSVILDVIYEEISKAKAL